MSSELPEIGLHEDIPNGEYHRGPGISKSGLDLIHRSPAHYMTQRLHPKPPTAAMTFGSAFHDLVLLPELFEKTYRPDPAPGSQSKDAKSQREELIGDGITIIHTATAAGYWERDDWRTLHLMRDAVMAHPIAFVLLQEGIP